MKLHAISMLLVLAATHTFVSTCQSQIDEIFSQDVVPGDALGRIVSSDGSGNISYSGETFDSQLEVRGRASDVQFSTNYWLDIRDSSVDLKIKAKLLAYKFRSEFSHENQAEREGRKISFTGLEIVEFAEESASPPEKGGGFYVSKIRRAAIARIVFDFTFSSSSSATRFRAEAGGGFMGFSGAAEVIKKARNIEKSVNFEIRAKWTEGHSIDKAEFFENGEFNPVNALAELSRWQRSIDSQTSKRSLIVVSATISPYGDELRSSVRLREARACYRRLHAVLSLLEDDDLRLTTKDYTLLEDEAETLQEYIWFGGEDRMFRRDPYQNFPLTGYISQLDVFRLENVLGEQSPSGMEDTGWGVAWNVSGKGEAWPGWWRAWVWYYPNLEWTASWEIVDYIEIKLDGKTIAKLEEPADFFRIKDDGIDPLRHKPNEYGDSGIERTQKQIANDTRDKIVFDGHPLHSHPDVGTLLDVWVTFVDGSRAYLNDR